MDPMNGQKFGALGGAKVGTQIRWSEN